MNPLPTLPLTTTEQLLALAEDGMERELIRGQLWEKPMTRRNPRHSACLIQLGHLIAKWVELQPKPRGRVLGGEAGFRLRRNPDTTVGIDVAYIAPPLAAATPKNAWLVDGAPVLAVEILSPSDRHEEITTKVNEYLATGVALVWVVAPDFCTVRVHRPGAEPELFNVHQQMKGDPELPGLQIAVAEIFDD